MKLFEKIGTPGKSLLLLLFFVLLKAACLSAVILYGWIELGPDEAQYWTWSQKIDWGYYSKPPAIAWQIWLGTALFGNSEWGVRFFSVVLSALQAFLIYFLGLKVRLSPQAALIAALMMAFSPLGILGSFFAITDVGFLVCWTLACLAFLTLIETQKTRHCVAMAICIAIGALFKWPIYLFWLFVLVLKKSQLPQVKTRTLIFAFLISLLGLLPALIWNAGHDFATFKHVFATVQGGSGKKAGGNLLEFLLSQALLFSPLLFIPLLVALKKSFLQIKEGSSSLYFCALVTGSSLLVGSFTAFFQKVQGNWIIFAYPTAYVLLAAALYQPGSKRSFLKANFLCNTLVAFAFFSLPLLYFHPLFSARAPSFRLFPLKHNSGGKALFNVLERVGYQPEKNFLVSDKYQTTSLLSFYSPGQAQAYFLNLRGARNNQFSYWPSFQEERKGQKGFFIWIENSPRLSVELQEKENFYQEALQKFFEKVHLLGFFPLLKQGDLVWKGALIFECIDPLQDELPLSPLY